MMGQMVRTIQSGSSNRPEPFEKSKRKRTLFHLRKEELLLFFLFFSGAGGGARCAVLLRRHENAGARRRKKSNQKMRSERGTEAARRAAERVRVRRPRAAVARHSAHAQRQQGRGHVGESARARCEVASGTKVVPGRNERAGAREAGSVPGGKALLQALAPHGGKKCGVHELGAGDGRGTCRGDDRRTRARRFALTPLRARGPRAWTQR